MTDDTWAREKATEITDQVITIEARRMAITAALLAARLAGWREGRLAAAFKAWKENAPEHVVNAIRAMPEPEEPRHD